MTAAFSRIYYPEKVMRYFNGNILVAKKYLWFNMQVSACKDIVIQEDLDILSNRINFDKYKKIIYKIFNI